MNLRWQQALWRNDHTAGYRLTEYMIFRQIIFHLPAHFCLLTATLNQILGYYRLLQSPWNIKPTVWLLWFHITTMSLVNDLKFYPLWTIHIPVDCWSGFHLFFFPPFSLNATLVLKFWSQYYKNLLRQCLRIINICSSVWVLWILVM